MKRRALLLVIGAVPFVSGCVTFSDADLLPVPDTTPVAPELASRLERKSVTIPGRQIAVDCLPASEAEGILIAFGGNSNAAATMLQVLAPRASARRLTLMVPSYFLPGEQTPTVTQLRAIADATYTEAAKARLPVFVLGFSLGSWIAIELAGHAPVQGLLLAGVGTTIAETFGQQYFPLNLILTYRADANVTSLDSPRAAALISAPSLLVISNGDTDTPPTLGRRVYAKLPAGTPKKLLVLHDVSHGRYLLNAELWEAADVQFGWHVAVNAVEGERHEPK